jgi:hypothetical protein
MDKQLHIPKPCHENWEAMTPEEQGRHCGVCCKVVVDFTDMPTEEVVEYISTRSSQKICGRFRSDQVSVPKFTSSFTSRMKVFAAALLFVFGSALFSSCRTRMPQHPERMGEIEAVPVDTTMQGLMPVPALDTPPPVIEHPKGEVICIPPPKDSVKEIKMGKVKYDPK